MLSSVPETTILSMSAGVLLSHAWCWHLHNKGVEMILAQCLPWGKSCRSRRNVPTKVHIQNSSPHQWFHVAWARVGMYATKMTCVGCQHSLLIAWGMYKKTNLSFLMLLFTRNDPHVLDNAVGTCACLSGCTSWRSSPDLLFGHHT